MAFLTKRKGVYHIRWSVTKHGIVRAGSVSCRGLTYAQTLARKRDIENRLARGLDVDTPDGGTFTEYVTQWLDHMDGQIAVTTHAMYRQVIGKHMTPTLGKIAIGDLGVSDIRKCTKAWKGLAPKTRRNLHMLLHNLLAQAVKWELIERNPIDVDDAPKAPRKELVIPTPEESRQVLRALHGTVYYLPVLLAFATGMRRGEVVGLRWGDYDAERGLFAVQRSASRYTTTVIKETKQERVRVFGVGTVIARILSRHARKVPSCAKDAYVCQLPDGDRLDPDKLSRVITKTARVLGVPLTLHRLRHLQATELIAAGVPIRAIADRLGHAGTSITQDRYGHVIASMEQQAVSAADTLIKRPKKSPNVQKTRTPKEKPADP